MNHPTFDAGGYPTETTLEAIRKWPYVDFKGLIRFVTEAWDTAGAVYSDEEYLTLATGGWSGNESIVDALRVNDMFWVLCWVSSYRGGRHEFDNKRIESE